MIIRGFILLVLMGNHVSLQDGITSNVINCTIGSENITLFNDTKIQYVVGIAFDKTSQENSGGIISGTNILCDNGNLNCPVVVKAALNNCNNSASPPFNCSFDSARTITFNMIKIHLQVKVIIKHISYAQKNETLSFTMNTEFVKSLFPKSESGKFNLTVCSLEAAPTASTSISSNEYSKRNFCLTDTKAHFENKGIQYQVTVDFDKSNKTENVNNIANILCQNVSLHCPAVVLATLASCDSSTSQTFDCEFNSTLRIKFNETISDLQIKVIIKNINKTQKIEALNYTVSTEFVKRLLSNLMPEKVNLTNCGPDAPSTTPKVSPSTSTATYSNENFCTIGLQNRTLIKGNFQYEVKVAFNKSSNGKSDGVINDTEILCQHTNSHCPVVVKATLITCFGNQEARSDCLFNLNRTISFSEKKFDLQVTVLVSNISDNQKNEAIDFTVSTKFVKKLFSESRSGKARLTNCKQEEIPTNTKSTSKSATATPEKKKNSKSSNGKIALVVLAFFILLGVAIIACYFKYRKNLSNRPAYYNDISLNDPLHTEIKFYKADGGDVEDNAEEDDDDDVLPLI